MKKKTQTRHKHVPQRTCIACREKTDKRELTRIVRTADAGTVVDLTGKRNGRGAYVCSKQTCWEKVVSTQLLDKALKTEISAAEKRVIDAHRRTFEGKAE